MDNRNKIKKTTYITIDSEYASTYGLSDNFIGKKIVLYEDRIQHIERHKEEFSSETAYLDSLNNIDQILKYPELISNNTNNNSLEFVKRMTDNTLVAVRLSPSKELKIRTMYPITNAKKNRLKN